MNKSKAISMVQVISAFLIVNYHTGRLAIPVLSKFAKFGFVFNTVFVFLSGYLITKSFSKNDKISFRNFLHRRINRIYPSLHIALLFVTLNYFLVRNAIDLKSVLYSASGINFFFSNGGTFGGGHLWFISVILLCYLLFIPTYHVMNRHPYPYLGALVGIFIFIAFFKYGSLEGIYNKVSSEIIFRFLYHFFVFSIAVFISLQSVKSNKEGLTSKKYIFLFFVFLPLYVFFQPNPSLGIFAIASALIVAISLIAIAIMIYPSIEKLVSPILIFAPITYEIYLIHFPVISAVDTFFHGKFVGYFIVFIVSVLLAYLIWLLSKPYSRLTKHFTGWLLRHAS